MKTLKGTLIALAAIMSLTAAGKPARPGIVSMRQPDGSVIDVRIYGDERSHLYTTADGYLLKDKEDGFMYYASLSPQGYEVSDARGKNVELRTAADKALLASMPVLAPQNLLLQKEASRAALRNEVPRKNPGLADTSYPHLGSPKALIVLVEFSNLEFETPDAGDYFNRELNEKGFSDNHATGSVLDYFELNSGGLFSPQFDVVGPVKVSKTYSYYGGNDSWGDDKRPGAMVKEACELIKDIVDFADYDTDGDGYVDNVYIYYAGRGEADGGGANTIWPHQWNLTEAVGAPLLIDGVRIDSYGCSNEIDSYTLIADGIGTFVHEFSHVLGLPDLYCTTSGSAFTPGDWSCLDSGPYNNDGRTPPNYSAFERYALGWMTPKPLKNTHLTLENLADSNEAYIIENPENPDEYYLFENRQQVGNDYYIPGHGMLVWHVDYVPSVWQSNSVNNNSKHQYVDLVEADGTRSDYSRDSDCFPGKMYIDSFTPDTKPAFKLWNGDSLGAALTNIAENDGVISFDCALEGDNTNIVNVEVSTEGCRWFHIDGRPASDNPAPGLYIVGYPDGSTRKVMIKE